MAKFSDIVRICFLGFNLLVMMKCYSSMDQINDTVSMIHYGLMFLLGFIGAYAALVEQKAVMLSYIVVFLLWSLQEEGHK